MIRNYAEVNDKSEQGHTTRSQAYNRNIVQILKRHEDTD